MKKHLHMFAFLLLPMSLTALSPPAQVAEGPTPATAAEATADLFAALAADDIDRAIAMTAPVKGVPPEAMRESYQEAAEHTKKAGIAQVVAHLQLADTAVVVIREGADGKKNIIDLDPAYLVRRHGRWIVLFELTSFDRPDFELDEAALTNFKKLQEWFDEQKPKLKVLLGPRT